MSDMSQGPGWWIASDDKWYPPHLHPSVRLPDAPTPTDTIVSNPSLEEDGAAAAPASDRPSRFVGSAAVTGGDTDVREPDGGVAGADARFTGHDGGFTGPDAGFPGSFETAPARHSRKRSRKPVAAALSVLVALFVVAGALVLVGGNKSASAQVIDAVTSTLGDKTAQTTVTMSLKTAKATITATGSGGMDFTHNALQLDMNVNAAGQQIPIQADYLGGVIYEMVPGLDQIIPGKSWISIDLSSLQNTASQDPGAAGLGSNPSVMLRMLAQQGNKVVALGPSTFDGAAMNGYAVTISPATVTREVGKADLPAWMRQALTGFTSHGVNLKVFVDSSDMLRSFEVQTTESTGASGTISVDETIAYSHYGAPVSVAAPPADQVVGFQQFLKAEQAQATPAP